jgi:hypothetical protein
MKRFLILFVLWSVPALAQQPVQPLPQTGTPADAETNTSTQLPRAGVYGFMYNGTTWDRLRGDTSNGLWVNVKNTIAATISGTVTVAGSGNFTVVQATGTNLHMVCDSGCSSSAGFADNSAFTFGTTAINPVGGVLDDVSTNTATENSAAVVRITPQKAFHINLRNQAGTEMGTSSNPLQVTGANGTFPVTGTFWQATQPVSISGNQAVNVAQLAGTATDTNSGNKSAGTLRVVIATDQPQLTNKLLVTPDANSAVNVAQWNGSAVASPDANSYPITAKAATATTAAGTSTCYLTSAVGVNNTNCKASAGNLYEIHVTNTTTTNYFLRLYNLSTAPTCSSSTGFVETIPALGASANGGINGRLMDPPQAFSTGIGFCLTGGGSSTDNTNAAVGVYITLLYK